MGKWLWKEIGSKQLLGENGLKTTFLRGEGRNRLKTPLGKNGFQPFGKTGYPFFGENI